jgi:hypothetical protein
MGTVVGVIGVWGDFREGGEEGGEVRTAATCGGLGVCSRVCCAVLN